MLSTFGTSANDGMGGTFGFCSSRTPRRLDVVAARARRLCELAVTHEAVSLNMSVGLLDEMLLLRRFRDGGFGKESSRDAIALVVARRPKMNFL